MINSADILNARILVVDDKRENVLLLERMLGAAGYSRISSTTEPQEVCALHREHRYDLILLDLQMPGIDGFEVMERLKAIETDDYLPVLVITAAPEQRVRALQAGAKDFVNKPFERAELLARVHNMLEVRQMHIEALDHGRLLERSLREAEQSRELIRRKSEEIGVLYENLLAERNRAVELTLQPGAMVGLEKEERIATPWLRSLRLRHPWLQINLLTAFIAAVVVGLFQGTIDRLLVLTMFLPVLAGQSGNTGSQALAITLRGLALGDVSPGRERALVRKEALLGLLNGALVGLVAALGMYGVARFNHLPSALMLSVVVFLAMIGSCIISGICGAVVPLVLKRLGADPATASSIFLTTATDVASMGLLLGLAAALVK